jgi:hypothetical protein
MPKAPRQKFFEKGIDISGKVWYTIDSERRARKNMNKYRVCFIKYYTYEIEADNEDEAIDIAEDERFYPEMRSPIADCTYDEVECDEL